MKLALLLSIDHCASPPLSLIPDVLVVMAQRYVDPEAGSALYLAHGVGWFPARRFAALSVASDAERCLCTATRAGQTEHRVPDTR